MDTCIWVHNVRKFVNIMFSFVDHFHGNMNFNALKRKVSQNNQGQNKSFNGIESPPFKQPKYQDKASNLVQQRKLLPIYSGRDKFINEAKQQDALILVGETGSGKTTQIPQYLYEHGLNRQNNCKNAFRIAITQPRRVAAISLAKRVSEEITASCKYQPFVASHQWANEVDIIGTVLNMGQNILILIRRKL